MVRKGAVNGDQCKGRDGALLLNPGWVWTRGHLRKLHTRLCGETALAFENVGTVVCVWGGIRIEEFVTHRKLSLELE